MRSAVGNWSQTPDSGSCVLPFYAMQTIYQVDPDDAAARTKAEAGLPCLQVITVIEEQEQFDGPESSFTVFQRRTLIINIIIGLVFVVGGLTGNLALRGTNSGPAIAVVGGLLILLGVYRIVRSRS